jgi:hypothetical protein
MFSNQKFQIVILSSTTDGAHCYFFRGATSNIALCNNSIPRKSYIKIYIADDNPSFVTLSHMKRNSSIPFIPSSEGQSCPNFSIFSVMVPVKEAAPFLSPPLQFFSIISFFTPSSPILSSLSSATVKSINLSEAPMTSAIPDSIFY